MRLADLSRYATFLEKFIPPVYLIQILRIGMWPHILHLGMSHDSLDISIYVSMHIGDSTMVDRVYRSCMIIMNGYYMMIDILMLYIVDFEVIYSMD